MNFTPSALCAAVAVLHDVVFAFEAEDAFGAGVGFGAGISSRSQRPGNVLPRMSNGL
jgi:hypothetical protein